MCTLKQRDMQEEMVAKKFKNDVNTLLHYQQQMEAQNIAAYLDTLFISTLKGKASGKIGLVVCHWQY